MCLYRCKSLFLTMKTASEISVKQSGDDNDAAKEFMCC